MGGEMESGNRRMPAHALRKGNFCAFMRFRIGQGWCAMAGNGEKKHDKHEDSGVTPRRKKKESAKTGEQARSHSDAGALREPWQMENTCGDEVSVPAIHHVGPTLESDPEFNDIPSSGPTPEAIIAKIGAPLPGEGVDRDIDALPELENKAAGGERLRTRLPGDTSSDPHTDLDLGNAATLQHRGRGKHRAA